MKARGIRHVTFRCGPGRSLYSHLLLGPVRSDCVDTIKAEYVGYAGGCDGRTDCRHGRDCGKNIVATGAVALDSDSIRIRDALLDHGMHRSRYLVSKGGHHAQRCQFQVGIQTRDAARGQKMAVEYTRIGECE